MTQAAAFQATYSDWKLIKTRKVVQIVFEVPVEKAGLAYEVLNGMPNFGSEVWCAVARLQQPKESAAQPRPSPDESPSAGGAPRAASKSFHELVPAQQAGILCHEPAFWKFLSEFYDGVLVTKESEASAFVREFCGVASRAQLTPELSLWKSMVSDYRAWMREPAVVA